MAGMITGPKLKMIRGFVGLTQAQLAEKAGVPINSIAEFELEKRDIRTGTVSKLCEAMGVQVTYTVNGTTISGP